MRPRKLLVHSAWLLLLIFVLNSLALGFHWYWSIWHFDMLMHFLGGFWIGLFAAYLFSAPGGEMSFWTEVLLAVFLVGVGWEVFEALLDQFITYGPFNYLDSTSDLMLDMAGGLSAVWWLSRCELRKHGNTLG